MSGAATRNRRGSRGEDGGARARILARVTRATATRDKLPHPGRLDTPVPSDPVATLVNRFTSQGGEVAAPDPERSPRDWLTSFLQELDADITAIAIGADVPTPLQPRLADGTPAVAGTGARGSSRPLRHAVAPAHADVGISMAWGAVAETGSLILPSTGARAVQLLPPIHIVWVPADRIFTTLQDALLELQPALPAGVGLHSGPSKSADIGQTVVTGMHGPGRCIAVVADP